jgi:putative ABC transport system permease protein
LNSWLSDLSYSLRRLARSPGFALTAVVLLSLTMSIATCLFALAYDIFYRPLPYARPDELATVQVHLIKENMTDPRIEGAQVHYFAHHPEIFQRFGALAFSLEWISNGPAAEPTELSSVFIEPEAFALLEMRPIAGRLPDEADAAARTPHRILVAASYASERYGSAAAAIGRVLELQSGQYQIIGVLPPHSLFPNTVFWLPVLYTPEALAASAGMRGSHVAIIARLARGMSFADAGRRMTAIADNAPEVANSPFAHDIQLLASPLRAVWTWPQLQMILFSLLGSALGLWLITVSNVGNLYVARLAGRAHESALMLAIGADPPRILRLHAQDALVIVGVSLALALALLPLEFRLIRRYQIFALSSPYPLQLDAPNLAFAILLGLLLGGSLVASAWWMQRSSSMQHSMQIGGTRQSTTREIQMLRTGLSVAQVTLTAVLLVGSGLLLRSARAALHENFGFEQQHLVMTGINLNTDQATFEGLVLRLADRIRQLPEVHEMTLTECNPVGFGWDASRYQPFGAQDNDITHWAQMRFCPETTANYFALMRAPILKGRGFSEDEVREHAPVAIVDSAFVLRNFADGEALGRMIRINSATDASTGPDDGSAVTALTIVGVVPAVKGLGNLISDLPVLPYVYTPGGRGEEVLIRTNGELGALRADLRRLVHEVAPQALLGLTVFANERVANFVREMYPANSLLTSIATVTLLLAALGLYSVLAYSTQMRQKEFAIRLALGESPSGLRRSVVREGLKWSGLGALVAIPLVWLTGRALQSQLYRIGPFDPLTVCAVALVIAGATLAATWLPARRAARTDPMQALRAE